jgi:hypothetical protein
MNHSTKHGVSGFKCVTFIVVTHKKFRLILICEGLELCLCLEFIIDLDFEGLRTC